MGYRAVRSTERIETNLNEVSCAWVACGSAKSERIRCKENKDVCISKGGARERSR